MKKAEPAPHMKDYGPLVVWLDDLEKISAVCEARGMKAEFVGDETRFESVEEIVEHFGQKALVRDLKVKATKGPYTTIDLDEMRAALYVAGGQDGSGVFFEIDRIMSARQLHWPFLYSQLFLLLIVGFNSLPWIARFIFRSDFHPSPFVSSASVLLTAWLAWSAYINLKRHSVVRLIRRTDAQSFWRRNSDQLVIAVVAALLGAIFGAIGIKLADNYWPKAGEEKQQTSTPTSGPAKQQPATPPADQTKQPPAASSPH